MKVTRWKKLWVRFLLFVEIGEPYNRRVRRELKAKVRFENTLHDLTEYVRRKLVTTPEGIAWLSGNSSFSLWEVCETEQMKRSREEKKFRDDIAIIAEWARKQSSDL